MSGYLRFYRTVLLLTLAACAAILSACGAVDARTMSNVAGYQVRKRFPPLLVYRQPPAPASLSGTVVDEDGQPIAGAVVLVSTVRGDEVHTRSDAGGRYRLEGITPGRVTPMAGAWGFDAVNGATRRLSPAQQQDGVDFVLPTRRPQPVQPAALVIGRPVQESSQFPEPMIATRIPFTFTLDGVRIDNGQIYLPAQQARSETGLSSGEGERARSETGLSSGEAGQARSETGLSSGEGEQARSETGLSSGEGGQARSETGLSGVSTLVIIYPSHPLNWNAASVALTGAGNPVLALGPHSSAGLDIDQHARNYRAALQLWQGGELTPLGQPDDRWAALSGSFSSLIMFKALQDLPAMPPAIVDVGGISDAFLGIQALYDANLAIPAPYDSAVAALGRPDRDPAFFYGFSPVFYADRLPPIFIIHTTNDEVIPHNQAEALAAALEAAGAAHELLLYQDTTHYLDAYNPTPATRMVLERVLSYVRTVGQGESQ